MSDLQHIKQRIAQIRRDIEQTPGLAREIEQRSDQIHQTVRRAEENMRLAKVIPITKGRRKDPGAEVEL